MKLDNFKELLDQWDSEVLEVVVRISVPDNGKESELVAIDYLDGEYAEISDERSVLFENGRVTIIADVNVD